MLAAMVALVAAGCGRAGEQSRSHPVEIDLTTFARPAADGGGAAPAAAPGGARELVIPAGRPLDLFLRVPAEARLVFALPAGTDPAALTIEAESGTERARLDAEPGEHDERVASLARFGDQIVRLRLTSQAAAPLALARPRIVGSDTPLAPVLAQRPQPAGGKLNVILYVVDTLRADHLSAYGYKRDTSPRIKELAGRGVLFERAYSAGSSTWPSIKALFASRFPSELGDRGLAVNGRVAKTLAEVFRDAGYATASFNGNFSLIDELGFGRGFQTYELLRREGSDKPAEVAADVIYDKAVAWVRAHRDEPFFLWIQTMDVHSYDAPPPWRGKFTAPPGKAATTEEALKALKNLSPEQLEAFKAMGKLTPDQLKGFARFNPDKYDEAVAYTDHVFGQLVDALGEMGLADRTAIVLTADHGEPLGQRGQMFHGESLHEELVHVPLVILLPGVRQGERIDTVVSLMDLAPTLAELAGLPVPDGFIGRSLLQARTRLRPASAFGEQPPFSWGQQGNRRYMWFAHEDPWKLLMDQGQVALYDLANDPGELTDVSAQHPVVTGYLVDALAQRVPMLRGGAAPTAAEPLTPEARQKLDSALRALGYIQ
jgi:arylsulfatase A-like enzyme